MPLAFRYTRLTKTLNVESDLAWILHIEKAPLGKFAGEARIDLPKLGEGRLRLIRALQMPQCSNPV